MDQVVKILLRLDLVRAHLLVIFALQETPSWDVENLNWLGTVFIEVNLCSRHLLSRSVFAKYRDHGDLRREMYSNAFWIRVRHGR